MKSNVKKMCAAAVCIAIGAIGCTACSSNTDTDVSAELPSETMPQQDGEEWVYESEYKGIKIMPEAIGKVKKRDLEEMIKENGGRGKGIIIYDVGGNVDGDHQQ